MVWPDGGTGLPHYHPYWRTCEECPAYPGWKQDLALFLFNPITISLILLLLIGLTS
jgi:hypothetical protein